jgi:WD40 repeat protein
MKRKFEELHEPYVSSKRAKIVLPLSAIENPSTTVTFAFASEYNSAIQYSVKELFTKIRSKFAEKPRAWTNEIVVSHNTGFQVWNFKQDKLVADINHTDAKLGDIISIVQLKNGYIATGSETGNIIIWDKLYAPLRVIRAHNRNVYCLLQLADGTLVSGTAPNLLRVWNVHTGEQISEMKHEETASVMDIVCT